MRSDSKIKTLVGVAASSQEGLAASADALLAHGTLVAGNYRIEYPIAHDLTATLYCATHPNTGERVAVRFLAPALFQITSVREQFLHAAVLGARISHPNLFKNQLFGGEHGSVYTIMELVRGQTLAERLASERLRASDAVALLMPVLRGIAAAHASGLIHGDLKPEHIWLSRAEGGAWVPKVLGFGGAVPAAAAHLLAGARTYYRAPEQLRGTGRADVRSDVYALGVCLFEAISGRKPFVAGSHSELTRKILSASTPLLTRDDPNVDPQLAEVVLRAMARDPEARYPSVKALALALEPFSTHERFRTQLSAAANPNVPALVPVPVPVPVPALVPALAQNNARTKPASQRPLRQSAHVHIATALLICAASGLYVLRSPQQRATASNRPQRALIVKPITEPTPTNTAEAELPSGLSEPTTQAASPTPQRAPIAAHSGAGAEVKPQSPQAPKPITALPQPTIPEPEPATQAQPPEPSLQIDRALPSANPAGELTRRDFYE